MIAADSAPKCNPAAHPPACRQCKHWVAALADVCLELQAARERLAEVDEDWVAWVAAIRHDFYRKIGGNRLTEAVFRAKTRHFLATEEHL